LIYEYEQYIKRVVKDEEINSNNIVAIFSYNNS